MRKGKRLAALFMSALLAAGSIQTPIWAEDNIVLANEVCASEAQAGRAIIEEALGDTYSTEAQVEESDIEAVPNSHDSDKANVDEIEPDSVQNDGFDKEVISDSVIFEEAQPNEDASDTAKSGTVDMGAVIGDVGPNEEQAGVVEEEQMDKSDGTQAGVVGEAQAGAVGSASETQVGSTDGTQAGAVGEEQKAEALVGDENTWNGFTWSLAANGTRLTLTGSGEMPNAADAPWRSPLIKNNITEVRTGNYITSIGANAFSDFPNLKTVKIGLRIRTIGEKAFAGCSALSTINNTSTRITGIGKGAFENCESLPEAFLPDTLKTIGARAFYSCGGIRGIVIPSGVTEIGKEAFAKDAGLGHVKVPESVTTTGAKIFSECDGLMSVEIECNVIRDGMFLNCSSLSEVILGEYVGWIGVHAFENCISLRSVDIPGGVNLIADSAFEGCLELASVTFASGLEHMCSRAFYGTGLTSVTLPDTLAEMGAYVFAACENLEAVDFGGAPLTVISANAFANDLHLASVNMGNSVKQIAANAFLHCQELSNVTFSPALEKIGQSAFAYDYALKAASLPASVTEIAAKAFYYCSDLEKASLGAEVRTIGENAFAFCRNLTLFTVHSMDAEYSGANVLRGVPATLHGYKGSTTEAYAAQRGLPFEVIVGLEAPVLRVCTLARTGVSLKWNAVPGAINYAVYRSEALTEPEQVGYTTTLACLDTSAVSGTTYYYYIVADDGSMRSEESETKKIFFIAAPKSVSIANTLKGMQVTWTAVTNAKSYIVYRKSGTDPYEPIRTVAAPTLTCVDGTAVSGILYTYAVAAVDSPEAQPMWARFTGAVSLQEGDDSAAAVGVSQDGGFVADDMAGFESVVGEEAGNGTATGLVRESKTYQRLTTPTITTVTTPSAGTMVVSWGKIDEARGYQVRYTTDAAFGKNVTAVTVGGTNTLNKTITGLTSGKTYYVRVLCYQKVGDKYYYSGNSLKKSIVAK